GRTATGDAGRSVYRVTLRQVAGPTHQVGGEPASLQIELGPDEIRSNGMSIGLEWLSSALPEAWSEILEPFNPQGLVELNGFTWRRSGSVELAIGLAGLSGSVPIEPDDSLPSRFARYLQFRIASGTLRLERGEAAASTQRPSWKIEADARGDLSGASFELRAQAARIGETDWSARADEPHSLRELFTAAAASGSLSIRDLKLPDLEKHKAFLTSARLPEPVRAFFADYRPRGRANLELTVDSDGNSMHGVFEPLGAACRYFRFPYDVEDIHGQVLFGANGTELKGLSGRHGATRILANGKIHHPNRWTGFDLTLQGDGVLFDRRLYDALPPNFQQLWRTCDPCGACDAAVVLSRENGSEALGVQPTHVRVDANLLAASLSIEDGARLHDVGGRVLIDAGRLTIPELTGSWEGAAVRFRGSIDAPDEQGVVRRDIRLEAAAAPLNHRQVLRADDGGELGAVSFEGVGDVFSHLTADEHGSHASHQIHVLGGKLIGLDGDCAWEHASGEIAVAEDGIQVRSLRADRAGGKFEAQGDLPGGHKPAQLSIKVEDAAIGRMLAGLVPSRWSEVRDSLGFSGAGRVSLDFGTAAETGGQVVGVALRSAGMKPAALPLDFENVESRLTISADGAVIHECRGEYRGVKPIELSGRILWNQPDRSARLTLQCPPMQLTSELIDALPRPLAGLLRRMRAHGDVAVGFDPLELVSAERGEWKIAGRTTFRNAALRLGLPMDELQGELSGYCRILPGGGVEGDADVTIEAGWIDGRPVHKWVGRLTISPGDPLVRIDDVRGFACGGSVLGWARFDPQSSDYELSLTLSDLSLAEYLKDDATKREQQRPGRLDGRIFLRGRGEDVQTRSGGGELRIRGGSLLASSVTRPLYEASRRGSTPLGAAVEQADLRFALEGDEMLFNRIDLRTRDMRLVGTGSWNQRDDRISMTLVAASTEEARRLGAIGALLESAQQELVQYRVEGTTDRPQVTAEPMHNLTEPLRRLFRGEP
ncbi:MAG: hypothetical protein HZB38_14275, partial [Planctomycetes bacterium]|nr:hypothetical protein [Planctomycetota bacterium]